MTPFALVKFANVAEWRAANDFDTYGILIQGSLLEARPINTIIRNELDGELYASTDSNIPAYTQITGGGGGAVFSVNGFVGVVVLTASDVGAAQLVGGNALTGAQSIVGGGLSVGTAAPAASAVLQVDSTTQGFLPPRMTTLQRVAIAPAPGLVVYDTDIDALFFYDGAVWVNTSSSGGLTLQQAYESGNTIVTAVADGAFSVTTGAGAPITFVLTGAGFTVDGAQAVNFGGGTPLASLNASTTGDLTLASAASVGITGAEAVADAVRVHASNVAGGIDIDAGTGGITVDTTGVLNLSSSTGDWQATGALTIDSSGGPISIGSDANAQAVNIATGAAARDVTIGNLIGSSRTAINAGTGASSWTVTGAGTFDLVAGTGTVNIAANATDHATLLGSVTGASATTIRSGSGNLTLTSPDVIVGTQITVPNTGLHILDTDASHDLILVPGSNLGADRTLTLLTGDASRSVDLTGAHGAVYYTNAAGNLVPLAPGVSGEFLRTQGAGADPTWGTVPVSVTLQQAYESGNTIVTTGAEGPLSVTTGAGAPIAFVLTGADFTVNGANSVDLGGSTALSSFNLDATGSITVDSAASGISFDGAGASNFSTSVGDLTLEAAAGNIILDAAITTITGDLVVQGTTTSIDSETVLISDNHLYLNAGYTTAASQTGGLVVNYLPIATSTTVAAGGFTAGVAAVSNPTVATTGAATFAVSQFIQVSGATDPTNNGLFEVLSHAANVLTIRGVGTTATVEAFTQNQFATSVGAAGSITRVNISVMQSSAGGVWQVGTGAVTPVVFSDVVTSASTSLQAAYEGGNTITTSAGEGNIAFTGTEDLLVTLADVDFDVTGSLTLDATGTISIGGDADTGAINLGTGASARALTLGNATGATSVVVDGGTGAMSFGANAADHTTTMGSITGVSATTLQAGTGAMTFTAGGAFDVNAAGAVTIDGPGISIDGTGASNFSVTEAGLTLSTITSGTLSVTSAGALNLSGTTGDWQATGALTIDSSGGAIGIGTDADAQAINLGTGAAARTITLGNITGATALVLNAGTGASSWTVTGTGTFSLVAGTGAINLAANATDHSTTLGSTTGTSATAIRSGTGNLTLTSPDVIVGTVLTVPNTGLHILDSDASHDLILVPGSNLAADRTLTLTTGDASRTIDLTGAHGAVYYTDAAGNLVPLAPGTSGQFLKTQGAAANPVWDTAGGGPTKGTATADFGASALGTEYVEVVVIGQAGILAGADVTVTMMAEATADHNAYEASLIPVRLTAGDIVAGTGFTIKVFSDWLLNGEFTVRWSWSN